MARHVLRHTNFYQGMFKHRCCMASIISYRCHRLFVFFHFFSVSRDDLFGFDVCPALVCVRYRGNFSGISGYSESSGSIVTNTGGIREISSLGNKGFAECYGHACWQRLSIQQRKSDLTTCLYHVVIKRIPCCECRISIASALQQLLRWREAVVKSVPLEVLAFGVKCQLDGL